MNDVVYHYASPEAALGILEKREVWGSLIHSLNDHSEYKHFFESILTTLPRLFGQEAGFDDMIDDLSVNISSVKDLNVFVVSFSEKGDLLSQWRGYCREGGYAMGFNREALKSHFADSGVDFRKVEYGIPSDDLLTSAFRQIVHVYGTDPTARAPAIYMAEQWMLRAAPFYKDEGFREEAEWRAVKVLGCDDDRVFVRPLRGSLRPTCRLALPCVELNDAAHPTWRFNIGLRDVIVSPGRDREFRSSAFSFACCKHGIAGHDVSYSSVPYIDR
ncbi:DUF2971 domain-containing protein [Brevundimonas sp.]|uniref:DUF2971 domain-containing protein n=1 Tax=Brevundimonas sp. TaxID=1871086 RepID=UPI0035B1031C